MRWFSLAAITATTALVAVPSNASAATKIGETFTPSFDCRANINFLQLDSAGANNAAPSDGVITSWSFQAPPGGTDLLKFKVGRPAVASDPGEKSPYPGAVTAPFKVVGESGLVDPAPGALNSYPVGIAALAGDLIGFYWSSGNTAFCSSLRAGYDIRNHDGDLAPSRTGNFTQQFNFQLDVSAILEPDCDKDGLGDETQDMATSPCPTCKGKPATIIGTSRNDVRSGTAGRDVVVGLGGNDRLSGLGGNDVICGGAGKDKLYGGKGKDTLLGEAGNDTLKGGSGKDRLKGGPGKDKQLQ